MEFAKTWTCLSMHACMHACMHIMYSKLQSKMNYIFFQTVFQYRLLEDNIVLCAI